MVRLPTVSAAILALSSSADLNVIRFAMFAMKTFAFCSSPMGGMSDVYAWVSPTKVARASRITSTTL